VSNATFKNNDPGDRPAGPSLTEILQRLLDEADETGQTTAERIAEKLVEMALAGDIRAIREVLDRLEGKVPARFEIAIKARVPIQIVAPAGAELEAFESALAG
jgi:hypothetical protein